MGFTRPHAGARRHHRAGARRCPGGTRCCAPPGVRGFPPPACLDGGEQFAGLQIPDKVRNGNGVRIQSRAVALLQHRSVHRNLQGRQHPLDDSRSSARRHQRERRISNPERRRLCCALRELRHSDIGCPSRLAADHQTAIREGRLIPLAKSPAHNQTPRKSWRESLKP
jgi:hypothetical protein